MQQKLKMEPFVSFIASPAGRWTRVVAGLAMITYGLSSQRRSGYAIAAAGVLPVMAGALDLCLAAPLLFGADSIRGDDIRRTLHQQRGFPQLGSTSAKWLSA